MAYIPTNWQTGDIVSSERLNKAEQGIADAQNGYTVETTEDIIVPQQNVTTTEEGGSIYGTCAETVPFGKIHSGDEIVISFEGENYTATLVGDDYDELYTPYGELPFGLSFGYTDFDVEQYGVVLITSAEGTYALKVFKEIPAVIVDDTFAEARGYNVKVETRSVIDEQEATTVAGGDVADGFVEEGVHELTVAGKKYNVTWNDTEYEVVAFEENGAVILGEIDDGSPSFVNYPFFIVVVEEGGYYAEVITAEAGTYTVSVSITEEIISTTEDFKKAIASTDDVFEIHFGWDNDLHEPTCDRTYDEIIRVYNDGEPTKKIKAYLDSGQEAIGFRIQDESDAVFVFNTGASQSGTKWQINIELRMIETDGTVNAQNGLYVLTSGLE